MVFIGADREASLHKGDELMSLAAMKRAEKRQRAVELHDEGLSYGEIGRELGIPRPTVQSWFRIRSDNAERSHGTRLSLKRESQPGIPPSPFSVAVPEQCEEEQNVWWPVTPMVAWLERKSAEYGGWDALALASGVDVGILRRISNQDRVSLRVIDNVTIALGTHPCLIYPDRYREEIAV